MVMVGIILGTHRTYHFFSMALLMTGRQRSTPIPVAITVSATKVGRKVI
jgi:hypothetical protein